MPIVVLLRKRAAGGRDDPTGASFISFSEWRYIYSVAAFVANVGDHLVKLAHDTDYARTRAAQHAIVAKLFGWVGDPDGSVLGANALDEIGESCWNVIPKPPTPSWRSGPARRRLCRHPTSV